MDDFAQVTALERTGPSRFVMQVPDGWQQGRGAFGGLVLGTLARAMIADEPEADRQLRTLSGDLCGPVLPGAAEIVTRALRRGSNQSNLAAELRQNGEVLAVASAVLSRPRPSPRIPSPDVPPPAIDWQRVAPMSTEKAAPFTRHYEYRPVTLPFAATSEARLSGFIRERVPLARVDAAALIARLDSYWPTLFQVQPAPRPMATISFVAEVLVDPATLPPTEPLLYRAQMAGLHEGFFVELRELWHAGQLVALNQQTFVIIK